MKIYDIIQSIADTSSTKAKQQIMEFYKDDEILKMCFLYAENPRFNFWVKSALTTTDAGYNELSLLTFADLDRLINREITGNDAREFIDLLMHGLTHNARIILSRIINKDLRCGAGTSIANKVWKNLIPEYPYMRCSLPEVSNINNISDVEWSSGVYSQLKHDGSFANVNVFDGCVRIFSRSGSIYRDNSLGIDSECIRIFNNNTQTHGELTVYDNGILLERQIGNGILNSILKGGELEKHQKIHYDVWDQIPLVSAIPKGEYCVNYEDRFDDLIKQIEKTKSEFINIGEYKIVYSALDAQEHYKQIRKRKLEGTIIKRKRLFWKDGTSKDQIKNKASIDIEMRICGFEAGKGKHAKTFGSIIVESEDALVRAGCSGFSDKLRQEIHENREDWFGAIVTVTINGIQYSTKVGKPHSVYLPRFIERRLDKNIADTLDRIEEQIQMSV
jgi:DNA ligase-1